MDALASLQQISGCGHCSTSVSAAPALRPASNGKTLPAGSTFPALPPSPDGGRGGLPAAGGRLPAHGAPRGHPPPRHGAELLRPSRSTRPWSTGSSWQPCAPPPPATPGARPGSCSRGRSRRRSTSTPPPTRRGAATTRESPRACARAPVVLLAYTSPDGLRRPATPRPTRRTAGLGTGDEAWPVPYWFGDAAFGVMAVLLGRRRRRARSLRPRHLPGRDRARPAVWASPRRGACSAPCCSVGPTAATAGPPRSTGPGPPTGRGSTGPVGERHLTGVAQARSAGRCGNVSSALQTSSGRPSAGPGRRNRSSGTRADPIPSSAPGARSRRCGCPPGR